MTGLKDITRSVVYYEQYCDGVLAHKGVQSEAPKYESAEVQTDSVLFKDLMEENSMLDILNTGDQTGINSNNIGTARVLRKSKARKNSELGKIESSLDSYNSEEGLTDHRMDLIIKKRRMTSKEQQDEHKGVTRRKDSEGKHNLTNRRE